MYKNDMNDEMNCSFKARNRNFWGIRGASQESSVTQCIPVIVEGYSVDSGVIVRRYDEGNSLLSASANVKHPILYDDEVLRCRRNAGFRSFRPQGPTVEDAVQDSTCWRVGVLACWRVAGRNAELKEAASTSTSCLWLGVTSAAEVFRRLLDIIRSKSEWRGHSAIDDIDAAGFRNPIPFLPPLLPPSPLPFRVPAPFTEEPPHIQPTTRNCWKSREPPEAHPRGLCRKGFKPCGMMMRLHRHSRRIHPCGTIWKVVESMEPQPGRDIYMDTGSSCLASLLAYTRPKDK
jgi:hypothetical protein